ncbi:hypothetical protein HanIR_Chr05g0224991 [Helianthus annuus]|nr:hypothetical protein HanIR_Chr05g0224991 [Helianthus annuus]
MLPTGIDSDSDTLTLLISTASVSSRPDSLSTDSGTTESTSLSLLISALSAISFRSSFVISFDTSINSTTSSFFASNLGHVPVLGSSKKSAKVSNTLGDKIDFIV